MLTVIDHARPWLIPRRTLAASSQDHEGAKMIRGATGRAAIQPATRIIRRPKRSASQPAARLLPALTRPKLIRKERIAVRLTTWKSCSASGASVERRSEERRVG